MPKALAYLNWRQPKDELTKNLKRELLQAQVEESRAKTANIKIANEMAEQKLLDDASFMRGLGYFCVIAIAIALVGLGAIIS